MEMIGRWAAEIKTAVVYFQLPSKLTLHTCTILIWKNLRKLYCRAMIVRLEKN